MSALCVSYRRHDHTNVNLHPLNASEGWGAGGATPTFCFAGGDGGVMHLDGGGGW